MSTPTVVQAWNAVMADLSEIRKNERSGVGGPSYIFRGIDTVMNAVGPVLRRHGVVVVPTKIVEAKHRDFTSDKNKLTHEAIITVAYRIYGPDGDHMDGESIGESADWSDKATTQAMSVAYRTFLLQATTMPTDAPEPDERYDERSADTHRERGWNSTEHWDETWKSLIDDTRALASAELVAWGREQGYTYETFTHDQATAWRSQIDRIRQAAMEPEPEPESGDPEPEEQQVPDAPPAEGFDRAGAWAAMGDLWQRLTPAAQREAGAWLRDNEVTAETVTAETSAGFYAYAEQLLDDAPKVKPPSLKDRGWKTRAELDKTLASLRERTAALPPADRTRVQADNDPGDDGTDFWTRDAASTWIADLASAETTD